jgi:hypothetical protein
MNRLQLVLIIVLNSRSLRLDSLKHVTGSLKIRQTRIKPIKMNSSEFKGALVAPVLAAVGALAAWAADFTIEVIRKD